MAQWVQGAGGTWGGDWVAGGRYNSNLPPPGEGGNNFACGKVCFWRGAGCICLRALVQGVGQGGMGRVGVVFVRFPHICHTFR